METELKLLIASADIAALRRLPLLGQHASAPPRTQLLRSLYFDTPAGHLRQHGLSCRVRRVGRAWIQTLKADAPATAGLHSRPEWEARVAGPRPELDALIVQVGVQTAWAKVLGAPGLAQTLVPIFETEVRRTAWRLRMPQAEIELALDQGSLRCGEAREPISELELELKAGSPAGLFALALQLQETAALRVGNLSKSARGYALLAPPASPSAVKAVPVILDAGMSVGPGLQVILGSCLAQMQDNEPGVLHGIDPESLHQMRVGMRRLRSALRLFRRWLSLPAALREELAWLDAELGAARDADVLADSTLAGVVQACPEEAALLALQRAVALTARGQRQRAAAAVGSARHSRLMLGLAGWVQTLSAAEPIDGAGQALLAEPVERAAKVVDQRLRKLRRSGERLRRGSAEERHDVRIAAKKARYAIEFLQSLHPADRFERTLRRLIALQDRLGALNDAAVAERLLVELAVRQPDLAGAASFARGYLGAAAPQQVRELQACWRRFERGLRSRKR